MSGKLSGQTAWISGAASGIGEAAARLFVEEGANVALVDLQDDRGHFLAREFGEKSLFHKVDVSDELQVQHSIDTAATHFGGLNIVVNCAGLIHVKLLHEYASTDWDRLMGVNLKSMFFSLKHAIPYFKKHARSYVVNVGSISSFVGQSCTPAYTASKAAVLGLSRSIALDYASIGLRCNCVCPGITDTPMLREHLNKSADPEAMLAERLRRVPSRKALSSPEVARSILYLSCDDSNGVTGTSLVIDGGYLAAAEWDAH